MISASNFACGKKKKVIVLLKFLLRWCRRKFTRGLRGLKESTMSLTLFGLWQDPSFRWHSFLFDCGTVYSVNSVSLFLCWIMKILFQVAVLVSILDQQWWMPCFVIAFSPSVCVCTHTHTYLCVCTYTYIHTYIYLKMILRVLYVAVGNRTGHSPVEFFFCPESNPTKNISKSILMWSATVFWHQNLSQIT